MIDENAFGILLSYFDVEDDEYGLERDAFVVRFRAFREVVRECLRDLPLGRGVRAIDLGHAHYVEVADGSQSESPLKWARKMRAHGSTSAGSSASRPSLTVADGSMKRSRSSRPNTSETRESSRCRIRASHFAAPCTQTLPLARMTTNPLVGAPVFISTPKRREALNMIPKNAPTILYVAGAGFFIAPANSSPALVWKMRLAGNEAA